MARQSLYDYKKAGIISAIETLTQDQGRAPSLREVAEVTDTSVATLHSYLTRLRTEGVVSWSERHHRSLKVIQAPPSLPVVSQRPGSGPSGFAAAP